LKSLDTTALALRPDLRTTRGVRGTFDPMTPSMSCRAGRRERGQQRAESQRRLIAGLILTAVRWVILLGIVASIPGQSAPGIDRRGLLAAAVVYALAAAALPRLDGRLLSSKAVGGLLLTADLLFSAVVFHLSGGIRSPYLGLWYLVIVHTTFVLSPPVGLGISAAAVAALLVDEMTLPSGQETRFHLYSNLVQLFFLPLIAWAGLRLRQEVRDEEVARRQMARRVATLEAEEAHLRQGLEAARRVQESLRPRGIPVLPGFTLAALSYPAEQLNGDLYELIALPDGRLFIAIADVCGKGLSAALLAVAVQQGIRQFAGHDPAAVLAELNRLLFDKIPDEMFATAVCMVINPRDGHVAVATAGHPAPLRWDQGRRIMVASTSRGMALGIQPEWAGETDQFRLAPGEALLLYTDGMVDARTGREERLGEDGLAERLGQAAPTDADSWLASLLHSLNDCTAWTDDVTAVAVVRGLDDEIRPIGYPPQSAAEDNQVARSGAKDRIPSPIRAPAGGVQERALRLYGGAAR
jgi:serine phosphatase RsbU (regulator of sigma subunit)